MKPLLLIFIFSLLTTIYVHAQTGREVHGTVTDSTKLGVPGANVKLISDKGDSTVTITDPNGKFVFPAVNGTKLILTITSIGYQSIKKHFALDNDTKPATLGTVILKPENNTLQGVTIVGVNPVTLKEDTVEYKASAYKVRENAPVEDLIKKLPGVDVDVNGNITTQGKQVTKVRINGKDFMGGDVQSATKNLPADVVENIQMIDDYGDQANLTGVKTGEPDKIMNITIRKDKNYGYFGQATAGDGEDALPKSQGLPDDNRYLFSLNAFRFNGDQQMALLGSINNTNVNTFSFNSNNGGGGGGGGFGGGFGGGGGGRGNASRGAQNSGSLITTQNGITDAHSIGANFRDQWGKALSVYGSYSVADNTVSTNSTNFQQNTNAQNPSTNNQNSAEKDKNFNERFTWNMEYKPDTINYLKVTPTFTYATTRSVDNEQNNFNYPNSPDQNNRYNSYTSSTSNAPSYGITALYNHRFHHKRNFSLNVNISSSPSTQYQHVVNVYTEGQPNTPPNQVLNTNSRTTTFGTTLSFLEPIGKRDYLELNYALSHSHTTNDKATEVSDTVTIFPMQYDSALSTRYNYNFTTNRFGLNYRFIEKKYNYTLGIAAQPATLDGYSPLTGIQTHINTFNIIPTARYIYNFSRSQAFSVNYNGSSSSPSFTQLQPVTDFSNATYPVQGNPDLKPQFTNNFSIRYNAFSFATGNIFFINFAFQDISNDITTNTITYPHTYSRDPRLSNAILTQYLNADGYYNLSGSFTYAKPWDNRKYSLIFTNTLNYTNSVSYLTNVSAAGDSVANKNIAKNLQLTPGVRFRVDFTDIIDAQVLTNYAINHTNNSVSSPLNNNTFTRTWNIGVNGKNYFKDWTVSYDFSKAVNYGYSSSLGKVTNPNILNMYVERRFLKDHRATIRLSAFDLFNQNTGFSSASTPSSFTETHVNRLSRYYLATFTLRLQKFAGKTPTQNPERQFRRNNRGDGGGGLPGGPSASAE
ncbi:MAG TPA: outer membrane beta-barrel protein [Mucilaginibacter sp.]